MNSVDISVIVIAHDRKEYLIDALKSANDQTLDRNKYEIICVKNFVDDNYDREITCLVDKLITSKSTAVGPKLKVAIEESRGEILSFLDYDDLFLPGKLQYVSESFLAVGRSVYLHNAHMTRRGNEDNLSSSISPAPESVVTLDANSAGNKEMKVLMSMYPDFNSSSISISRKIIVPRLNQMEKLIMHPDTFIFYAALESGGILVDDPRVLTVYRVHGSTTNYEKVSIRSFFSSGKEYYSKTMSDWDAISSILSLERNGKMCECQKRHSEILGGLFSLKSKRSELFRVCLGFGKCLTSRSGVNLVILEIIVLGAVFLPRSIRALYFLIRTRP